VTGLTASHATSLMTEGHDKSLSVLVEDGCAKALLTEILRRMDPIWLQTIQIHEGGDCNSIKTTMRVLKDSGITVAAVLDGDQTPSPENGIFTLPGSMPPEKVILGISEVRQYLQAAYHLEWADFEVRENIACINHHEWIPCLARCISMDEISITRELARVASGVLPENNLTAMLKETAKQ
jgi:hypothetical protein